MKTILFSLIACVLLVESSCMKIAGAEMKELRVLDRTGLVRAAAKIAGTGTISTCPISEAHSMSLTSLDSIDRTVIGQAMQKPNTAFTCYQFKNVEAGNWEIRIDPPENRPREVSIKKDQ